MIYDLTNEFIYDSQYSIDIAQNVLIDDFQESLKHVKKGENLLIDNTDAFIKASVLDWDSEHFQVKMAKLDYFSVRDDCQNYYWQKIDNWVDTNKIKHLSYRTNQLNRKSLNILSSNRFDIVANKYMLRLAKNNALSISSNLEEYEGNDINKIIVLASNVFTKGRFFNDLHIDIMKSKELYSKWLKNSLNDINTKLIVKTVNGCMAGFVLYKIGLGYSKNIDKNFLHGFISLIATNPDENNKGIGKELLNSALVKMFSYHNVEVVYANTDLSNIAGLGLFQSSNFKVFNVLTELRKWYGDK